MPPVFCRTLASLLACCACGPLAAGEWSPATHIVGLQVVASAGTLHIRTPVQFVFNPAKCPTTTFEYGWNFVRLDASRSSATARRQMTEDLYLAFLLGHGVSLYVENNPATDCLTNNRIVTGVRVSR